VSSVTLAVTAARDAAEIHHPSDVQPIRFLAKAVSKNFTVDFPRQECG